MIANQIWNLMHLIARVTAPVRVIYLTKNYLAPPMTKANQINYMYTKHTSADAYNSGGVLVISRRGKHTELSLGISHVFALRPQRFGGADIPRGVGILFIPHTE